MRSRRRSSARCARYPKLQHGEHLARVGVHDRRAGSRSTSTAARAPTRTLPRARSARRPARFRASSSTSPTSCRRRSAPRSCSRYGYDLDYADIGAALGSNATAARQAASAGIRRLRQKELSMNAVSPNSTVASATRPPRRACSTPPTTSSTRRSARCSSPRATRGLCRISYDADPERELEQLARDFGVRVAALGEADRSRAARARRVLRGQAARRFDLPLDVARLADFNRRVLRELARVPYGEVVTYGELAARSARPQAARRRRHGDEPQPTADRPAVPPRGRGERQARRLRRRARPQGKAAQARGRDPVGSATCIAGEPSAARSTASPPLPTTASVEAAGQGANLTLRHGLRAPSRTTERKVTRCQCRIARRCN